MAIISSDQINDMNAAVGTGDASSASGVASTIKNLLTTNVMDFILPIAAFVILIFGIYGGVLYFTAYGNEEKVNRGKNTMLWAVVGAVVIAAAYMIINWWTANLSTGTL